MKNLLEILENAGCEIDHHESDLYARVTPESTRIIEEYKHIRAPYLYYTTFYDNLDNSLWYEIPFMYYREDDGTR